MSAEHEASHCAIARLLGLPQSPTLATAPFGAGPTPVFVAEEAATLSLQALSRALGISLLDLWDERR